MALPPDRWSPSRRPPDHRHTRTAVTLLALAGFVLLAGWIAWSSLTEPSDADEVDSAAPTCLPAPTTTPPAPADIRLNVYNSTDRNGLASSTARAMRERAFRDPRHRQRPAWQGDHRYGRGAGRGRQPGRRERCHGPGGGRRLRARRPHR